MPAFAATFEFCDDFGKDGLLRIDKSLQIVGIVHCFTPPIVPE
jgi:hypothetical protein